MRNPDTIYKIDRKRNKILLPGGRAWKNMFTIICEQDDKWLYYLNDMSVKIKINLSNDEYDNL